MNISRRRFKLALKTCRNNEDAIIENNKATSFSRNNPKEFWKQISKINTSKTACPTVIEGHSGPKIKILEKLFLQIVMWNK